ncbi:MAG: hypothetical protein AB7U85_02635 [Alphaproteobacteria bacterium]
MAYNSKSYFKPIKLKIMKPEFNKKTANILVRVTLIEKHTFSERAKRHDLSMSAFLRTLVRQAPEKIETIKNLLKINADLARLGNLFKMALDEDFYPEELNKHINAIADLRAILRAKIEEL